MRDYPKDSIDGYVDLATHNSYDDYLLRGYTPEAALAKINIECRENSRTPVQWNDQANGGFSEVTPWFAVNPNYQQLNMAAQQADPSSLLNFFKKITKVRKAPELTELMVYGRTIPVLQDLPGVVGYYRERNGQRLVQLANLTDQAVTILVKKPVTDVLLTNQETLTQTKATLTLQPYQAILYQEAGEEAIDG